MRPVSFCILSLLIMASCTQIKTVDYYILDFTLDRGSIKYLSNQLSVETMERANEEVDTHFKRNNRDDFLKALRYGNYLLDKNPGHLYAAQIANRCAWACLFALTEVRADQEGLFDCWDANVLLLAKTVFYSQESRKRDQDPKGHWKERADRLLHIARDGYMESFDQLITFLEVRKMMMIDSTLTKEIKETQKVYLTSLEKLKSIKSLHPTWLSDVISRNIKECEMQIKKINMIQALHEKDKAE